MMAIKSLFANEKVLLAVAVYCVTCAMISSPKPPQPSQPGSAASNNNQLLRVKNNNNTISIKNNNSPVALNEQAPAIAAGVRNGHDDNNNIAPHYQPGNKVGLSVEELVKLAENAKHRTEDNNLRRTIRDMLESMPEKRLLNRFNIKRQKSRGVDLSCEYQEITEVSTSDPSQNNNNHCYQLLSPRVQSKPAWFFLGDSRMGKMFHKMNFPYEVTSIHESKDAQCGFLDYCHLDYAGDWKPPKSTLTQGPIKYGLENNYCSESTPAGNKLVESNIDGNLHFMERLSISFASDVEQQTPYTRTSQQTATLHIANQLQLRDLTRDDSVCVVNSGLHDLRLCKEQSDGKCLYTYLSNVNSYLTTIENVCGTIIWLSIAPKNGAREANDRIREWNKQVKMKLSKRNDNFVYVDIMDVASRYEFADKAHLDREYYARLGKFFTNLMA